MTIGYESPSSGPGGDGDMDDAEASKVWAALSRAGFGPRNAGTRALSR